MKYKEMIDHVSTTAGEAIFLTDEVDFRARNITRDKETHFTMIKESIQ